MTCLESFGWFETTVQLFQGCSFNCHRGTLACLSSGSINHHPIDAVHVVVKCALRERDREKENLADGVHVTLASPGSGGDMGLD
mmetsp:Transcript_47789/g.93886  ORF Transcript_47789/g.93886 Transcript_47789/m.93886 type:complete len:84 (+) Transcript_47789:133-384(+)